MKPLQCSEDNLTDPMIDIDDLADELLSDSTGKPEKEEENSGTFLLEMGLNDKTLHSDFDNNFGDLYDNECPDYMRELLPIQETQVD